MSSPLPALQTIRCFVLLCIATSPGFSFAQQTAPVPAPSGATAMEIRRPVRSWEFVDAVGQRAAIFANEAGTLEAWVYPLKLLRDFKLRFHLKDRVLEGQNYAREVIAHPESPSIVYATAGFTVRESLIVPPGETGSLIRLDIDTFEPVQIEAQFVRDFQLMWPAGLGGTFIEWRDKEKPLNVFMLGHEQKIYAAVLGSPQTAGHTIEFFSNSGSSNLNSLLLQPVSRGRTTQFIFIAGSGKGPEEAIREYEHLLNDQERLESSARDYYSDYLNKTLSVQIPDAQMQAAYDWSRISLIQGLVDNPALGRGLIAGYRTAGDSSRPGFSWFFGRDSLWTDFAFDSMGDFGTVRTALEFISKFQRADGKIEHEIPQTASLVPWFTNFRYAYAAADATPLYILATNDYVSETGDIDYLNQHWDNLWRAYRFLHSTYDAQGVPKNFGVGHGWIEGGPLFPVESELYQSGLGAASLFALAHLAQLAGKADIQKQLETEFAAEKQIINNLFWSAGKNTLVFASNEKGERVELATVLSTAPMWFDVFDPPKIDATIDHLAGADHASDWGMRVFSNQNPLFDPTGYHFGSVWPLFTGWASLAEYRWHRPLAGYANLQANSQLALDGSPGHVTEVLSGSYYEPLPESSPHQIWSSAMVVLPLVRGLLGITNSRTETTLTVAPHVPADWNRWSASNVPACGGRAELVYTKDAKQIALQVEWHPGAPRDSAQGSTREGTCKLVFSPAISPHATVGKNIPLQKTVTDRHPTVSVQLTPGMNSVKIPVARDFGIVVRSPLPSLGGTSRNLRVVKQEWSADGKNLRLQIQGLSGVAYRFKTYGAHISSLEGGRVAESGPETQEIEVDFPLRASSPGFSEQSLVLHFAAK
jgi:GH15 family glucan-1,4-alpha-glucosidase